ncbi:hypothetical protein GCM10009559_48910 [Pseudonocardia zijingensis]|uniref:Uncharacterized protein n=1 Tax=Pseudonocardia zijingensis TaxID=153376 RepID=A0ABN1QYS7_9PSEU
MAGVGERAEHQRPLVRIGELQPADGHGGVGHQLLQDLPDLPQQPRRRAHLDEPDVVLQLQAQPVAGEGHQRHRVVRERGGGEPAHRQALVGRAVDLGEVLDDHERVEQGAQAARPGELRQPGVLVVEHGGLLVLQAAHHGADGLVLRPRHRHRHGVDQQADHGVDARHGLPGPSGHRGAEDHRVVAEGAPQQHAPGGVQHGADGDPEVAGGAGESGRLLGRKHVGDDAVRAHRRARVGVDEQGGLVHTGQRLRPHRARLPRVGGGEGGDVPAQRHGGHAARRAAVGVDDVVEHQRVRPAVGDDVVHRLHQPVVGGGQRHHAVAQQRRLGQVERPGPVGGGHPLQLGQGLGVRAVAEVDHPPVELDAPADHLDDPPVGEVAEPGAQGGVALDHHGHRVAQRVRVERAGELGDLLDAVGVDRVVPVARVEVHALLQGKQRQHVLQAGHRAFQLGHVGGVERDVREVRRRVPRDGLVACDGAEQLHPAPGQRRHLVLVEHGGGPAEPRRQLRPVGGVDGDGVDLEGARQRHPRVAVLADLRSGGEAAQVVEQHGRCRREVRRTREVAQRAVAQAGAGHRPQLLLDPLHHRGRPARRDIEGDRVERGEPADGAGEVDVAPQQLGLPAVPLHLQQQP